MVLPSGQVFSKTSLLRLTASQGDGVEGESVVDPVTHEVVRLVDVRRAFFL